MTPQKLIQKYNLSLSTVFVPYSQSHNASNKWKSLNWKVTLLKGEQEVVTFDYSCGIGHCPANSKVWKSPQDKKDAINLEVENGRAAKHSGFKVIVPTNGSKIEPEIKDVLYSLVIDSEAFNYCGFEDWCGSFGYSSDSIKAKGIYETCLETALKLRGYLGQSFFDDAAEAFEDY